MGCPFRFPGYISCYLGRAPNFSPCLFAVSLTRMLTPNLPASRPSVPSSSFPLHRPSPSAPRYRSGLGLGQAMRNELSRMVANTQDPAQKKIFDAEMQSFFLLFNRYLAEKAKGEKM